MNIASVAAYTVFDSRGVPTVEAEVILTSGHTGLGTVPSGASTGQFEAHELRDGDPARFAGKSVDHAVANVAEEIAPALIGRDAADQAGIDRAMIDLDGTANKSRLGANAVLAVSMAVARAAAAARGLPLFAALTELHPGPDPASSGTRLPLPEIQILGGGAHADWRTDLQDIMVIATGATTYPETLRMTHDVYRAAAAILKSRGCSLGLADEGGFWPDVQTNAQGIELVLEAIERAGYLPGTDLCISLDVASADLYDADTDTYRFHLEDRTFTPAAFADLMVDWCDRYHVVSLEDPLADADWDGWAALNQRIGQRVQLVGDDLFTTNPRRLVRGIEAKAANCALIKLNQIGTVTETLDAIRTTQAAGWAALVSARSGETEDAFIAHLAVATNAGQLKVGSFARSERMVKWNEVLRIARKLGGRARFDGAAVLPGR